MKPTLLLVALLLAAGDLQAQQLVKSSDRACTECHRNVTPERSKALTHADSVSCMTCHHVALTNNPKQIVARRTEVCKGCHTDLLPTHTRGKLGQPACEQCHTIHTPAGAKEVTAIRTDACKGCHERPHVLHTASDKATECTGCHKLHGGKPMRATDPAVSRQCASCHKDAHPSHATLAQKYPACVSCHSLASDAKLAAIPTGAALSAKCTSCHKNLTRSHAKVTKGAPECADCHDFTKDAKFPAVQVAVSQRCGSCHEKELKSYKTGGHAKGMAQKGFNADLPNCVTCHKAHDPSATVVGTRYSATTTCIKCHSDEKLAKKYDLPVYAGGSYLKDYHGATVQFATKHPGGKDQPNVMTCADCHGAHEVGWNDKKLVSDVCVSCHEKGDVKLAGAWLGHDKPSLAKQPLIFMVKLFYYMLVPFMLLGLTILIVFQLVDQRRKGATVLGTLRKRFGKQQKHEIMVPRFTVRERLEHFGSMATFITLTVTGLPQVWPNNGFAHWIISVFGGIDATRFIHRVAGFAFVALMVMHVTRAILVAIAKKKMPVMVPNKQDFFDTFGTIKHFFKGTPRPKTGKFDFSEKFEYWGLFLGGIVMSTTGIVLVFPDLVSQYVPGIIIAIMRTMHGLEATFAVLVVALWHSYGVILRPEVFPLDTSIFTGKISLERLEEEHGREFEELLPEHPEWALEHESEEEEEMELVGT